MSGLTDKEWAYGVGREAGAKVAEAEIARLRAQLEKARADLEDLADEAASSWMEDRIRAILAELDPVSNDI